MIINTSSCFEHIYCDASELATVISYLSGDTLVTVTGSWNAECQSDFYRALNYIYHGTHIDRNSGTITTDRYNCPAVNGVLRASYKVALDVSACDNICHAVFSGGTWGFLGLVNIVLPTNLSSIAAGAFAGAENLCSIVVPKSVKKIGDYAFTNCKSLKSITLSSKIELNKTIFRGCDSLDKSSFNLSAAA